MLDSDESATLYNKELIARIKDQPTYARLASPDANARDISPICGSEIIIDLQIERGRITDIGYEISACALTKTVLSIFLTQAIGQNHTDIYNIKMIFEKWLEAEDTDDISLPSHWQELSLLAPARSYQTRHHSMLLPFTAALKAMKSLT